MNASTRILALTRAAAVLAGSNEHGVPIDFGPSIMDARWPGGHP
ncbi:hypothetical protein [Micromonospora sp. NPDC005324]